MSYTKRSKWKLAVEFEYVRDGLYSIEYADGRASYWPVDVRQERAGN